MAELNRKQKRQRAHRNKASSKKVARMIKFSPILQDLKFRPTAYMMSFILDRNLTIEKLHERFKAQVREIFLKEEARLKKAKVIK